MTFHGSPDVGLTISYSKATGQWETLEAYLVRIFCLLLEIYIPVSSKFSFLP